MTSAEFIEAVQARLSIVTTVTKTTAVAKLHVGGTGPTIGLTGKVAWNLVQTLVYL